MLVFPWDLDDQLHWIDSPTKMVELSGMSDIAFYEHVDVQRKLEHKRFTHSMYKCLFRKRFDCSRATG